MNDVQTNSSLSDGSTLLHGKYIIREILEQDNIFITYKAIVPALNIHVIIKEMFLAKSSERSSETMDIVNNTVPQSTLNIIKNTVISQARKISRIRSASILRVTDIFEEHGTAYVVLESPAGITLEEKLKLKPSLSLDETLHFAAEICSALEDLHSQGIIHRKICPESIFITETDHVKLIDAGIPKQPDSTSDAAVIQYINPGFSPVEQYSGTMKEGQYTDTYSLGALCYYMLTGKTPPEAMELHDKQVPSLKSIDENIPDSVSRAVQKAMNTANSKRFQTADAFLKNMTGASSSITSSLSGINAGGFFGKIIQGISSFFGKVGSSSAVRKLKNSRLSGTKGKIIIGSAAAAVLAAAVLTAVFAVPRPLDYHFNKFDDVGYLQRSENRKHYAYWAKKDGKYLYFVDGKQVIGGCDSVWPVEFSEDGGHYALTASKDGKIFVIYDGQKGDEYDDSIKSFQISKDGTHYCYVGSDDYDENYFVYDGVKSEKMENIEKLQLSEDGKHYAYLAGISYRNWAVIYDGTPIDSRVNILSSLKLSKNGQHCMYTINYGWSRKKIVYDGKEFGPFDFIWDIDISDDGSHFTYISSDSGEDYQLYYDGELKESYEKIIDDSFLLSSDGLHYIYEAYNDYKGDHYVVYDGQVAGTHKGISNIQLSDDGTHYLYWATDGDSEFAVYDGSASEPYEDAASVQLSEDGTHYLFEAIKDGKKCIIYDGKTILNFVITADGPEVGVVSLSKNGKNYLVEYVNDFGNGFVYTKKKKQKVRETRIGECDPEEDSFLCNISDKWTRIE